MKSIEQAFDDLEMIKASVCRFADSSERCTVLDSNASEPALHEGRYELIAGVGCSKMYSGNLTTQLSASEASGNWKFAGITYGDPYKEGAIAEIYEPELVFIIKRNTKVLSIVNNGISKERFEFLLRNFRNPVNEKPGQAITESGFEPETDKKRYIQTVEQIREDIRNGAYYEMNYCIGFTARLRTRQLLPYYFRLCSLSAAPFSAYVKNAEVSLLCSSPERFIMRSGNKIVSQPIKGTNAALAGAANHKQLELLKNNEKERAENVMIVDLVRNDLARICRTGTVQVDELCGAYTYRSVNHLVSSVSGELKPEVRLKDIFYAMFPMGSMTGAPKKEVMKHIELYETGSRGIYSGCIGYISPDGDFDFNVVIRTLVYEPGSGKISYRVGSAITYDSVPEKEYEECMLKGSRLASVFRDSVL